MKPSRRIVSYLDGLGNGWNMSHGDLRRVRCPDLWTRDEPTGEMTPVTLALGSDAWLVHEALAIPAQCLSIHTGDPAVWVKGFAGYIDLARGLKSKFGDPFRRYLAVFNPAVPHRRPLRPTAWSEEESQGTGNPADRQVWTHTPGYRGRQASMPSSTMATHDGLVRSAMDGWDVGRMRQAPYAPFMGSSSDVSGVT